MRLAGITVALVVLASCATTVDDPPLADDNLTPISGGVIVDASVPATTIPVEGTAAELLPEMVIEMSRLGALVIGDGDQDASLARIQQMWLTIRPEIEESRPGLANGIGATVELAVTAVERTRPADADKAFSLLTDLVDAFTGDS